MKVGFIGLGNMGRPMAKNVAEAGHEVVLWNRTREKAEDLAEEIGAAVADTPADAARGAEVVVTMLTGDEAVREVAFGEDSVVEGLAEGAVHACTSTIGPAFSSRLAASHDAADQGYVAAPVFGRPEMAEAGDLWVVAAGAPEAVERCRPVLEAFSQGVLEVGEEPERANVVKVAGNFLLAAAIGAMGEAFALVRKHGIEPARFLEIANGHVLRSPLYEGYGGLIVSGEFEPAGFALKHGLKDMRLVQETAEAARVPMPLLAAIHDRLLSGAARGWEDMDWSAVARVIAADAGLD